MEDFLTLPEGTDTNVPFVGESFLFHTENEVESFVRSHPSAVLKSPWSAADEVSSTLPENSPAR